MTISAAVNPMRIDISSRYRDGVDWQIWDRKTGARWDRETLDVRMAG